MANKILNRKKAQEEMVGFVLIVVLVAVIAVVFLVIYLQKPATTMSQKSNELDSFIKALSQYTTDCQIPDGDYKNIGELVVKCDKREVCGDGRQACDVLENTLKDIMNASFTAENGSYIQYYSLELYKGNYTQYPLISPIISSGSGNLSKTKSCAGTKLFNERAFNTGIASEEAVMRVEVCIL